MTEYIIKAQVLEIIRQNEYDLGKSVREDERLAGAEVTPVRRGQWIEDDESYPGSGQSNYRCSSCGEIMFTAYRDLKESEKWDWCPGCGAKMKED